MNNFEVDGVLDAWNYQKRLIRSSSKPIQVRDREVWWCSLGENIGDEENGKNEHFERPVLVFRVFSGGLVWVIPLTSRHREGIYYYSFTYEDHTYTVMLSQLRCVSTKRLNTLLYILPSEHFLAIRGKIGS